MTTAHRPTFDPARGKEALRGPAYHQRLLPAYTTLKFRQPGQGGDPDAPPTPRDLRAELLAAEAEHYAKVKGTPIPSSSTSTNPSNPNKRPLPLPSADSPSDSHDPATTESPDSKRRRILAETRDIDADDDSGGSEKDDDSEEDDDDSEEDSDDDSDDELQRELERVRKERQAKREQEERERQEREEKEREKDIARGNPLLNKHDFGVKRRWDDDVVFRNQARGTEEKGKREFVNDLLRSDFHKRFMSKYVR